MTQAGDQDLPRQTNVHSAQPPAGQNITVTVGADGRMTTPPQSNGMAVAGFILALCSVVLFWTPVVNFVLWILGIVFSAQGMKRAKELGAPNGGLAKAGLIIALVPGTILVVVVFLILIVIAGAV